MWWFCTVSTSLRGLHLHGSPAQCGSRLESAQRDSHQTGGWKWSSSCDPHRVRHRGASALLLILIVFLTASPAGQLHMHQHTQQHSLPWKAPALLHGPTPQLEVPGFPDSQVSSHLSILTRASEGALVTFLWSSNFSYQTLTSSSFPIIKFLLL